jgi:hypothetical protein
VVVDSRHEHLNAGNSRVACDLRGELDTGRWRLSVARSKHRFEKRYAGRSKNDRNAPARSFAPRTKPRPVKTRVHRRVHTPTRRASSRSPPSTTRFAHGSGMSSVICGSFKSHRPIQRRSTTSARSALDKRARLHAAPALSTRDQAPRASVPRRSRFFKTDAAQCPVC